MKKNAMIINTSRGEILDEKALVKALQERWISGAGLDVVYPEPPDDANPLFQMDNVILTPHIAGWSSEALSRFLNKAARNLMNALMGELPEALVNPEAVPIWKARIEKMDTAEDKSEGGC
jgi:phosphoglycerate dehydrogenase-like enzyme